MIVRYARKWLHQQRAITLQVQKVVLLEKCRMGKCASGDFIASKLITYIRRAEAVSMPSQSTEIVQLLD
jgi:hypothetical protein